MGSGSSCVSGCDGSRKRGKEMRSRCGHVTLPLEWLAIRDACRHLSSSLLATLSRWTRNAHTNPPHLLRVGPVGTFETAVKEADPRDVEELWKPSRRQEHTTFRVEYLYHRVVYAVLQLDR